MSYVEPHMRESLKDHVLEPYVLAVDPKNDKYFVESYYLRHPDRERYGRMQSCLILFTREGIVIMGDLTPGHNGVVSCLGYGSGWFSQKLSESYLCEKFLQKEYVPEVALRCLKGAILERRKEKSYRDTKWEITREDAREAWDEAQSAFDDGTFNADKFYEIWTRLFNDTPEGGYDYPPADAGWLCAIQQKFAELYAKRETP